MPQIVLMVLRMVILRYLLGDTLSVLLGEKDITEAPSVMPRKGIQSAFRMQEQAFTCTYIH